MAVRVHFLWWRWAFTTVNSLSLSFPIYVSRESIRDCADAMQLTRFLFYLFLSFFSHKVDGYGSLDRSWARNRTRIGGVGHKKRPDLMSADFTGNGGTLVPSPLAGPPCLPDSSNSSMLEPLPESTAAESRRSPRRDWKPPLENTDVVGVMEAIAGDEPCH